MASFLDAEIQRFRDNRDQLKTLLEETQQLLETKFAEILSQEFSRTLLDNLKLEQIAAALERLYCAGTSANSRPSIVIVGQTKSGKSSFINELLGGTFVAQSESPCTARVTRLTYSDSMFVRVLDKDGKEISRTPLEKPRVDEDLLKLKDEHREDESLISSSVEVNLPCDFLRNGVDVVDSPGLNENSALDSLTMGAVDSFLPIIIYVIDSNSGLTLAVQKDLEAISRTSGQKTEIFYLVTKMDVSKETVEEAGRSEEEIEEEKADRVFRRLQELHFIPKDESSERCHNFLCVSCWEVRRYRRRQEMMRKRQEKKGAHSETVKEAERPKWVKKFDEVKLRILEFAREQFKNMICSVGAKLRNTHSQVLTMFLDRAQSIKESSKRKQTALASIQELESRIHEESKAIIDKNQHLFVDEVDAFFKKNTPLIRQKVKEMEYSEDIIAVRDGSALDENLAERCVQEIRTLIEQSIVHNFSEFLRSGALKSCREDFDRLKDKVAEYEKDVEQTPAYQVLKQTMLDGYELSSGAFLTSSFTAILRKVSRALSMFFRRPSTLFNKPVRDPDWKDIQAEYYLSSIDKKKLVSCLMESLHEWFKKRHDDFTASLEASQRLVETDLKLSENERVTLRAQYPKVALLHMRVMDVLTSYQLASYSICTDMQLGAGAQGEVFQVLDADGNPALAAKRMVADKKALDDIASEVYHSSILEHPNLLKISGVRLKSALKEKWTVELYMPLMSGDVWERMQQKEITLKQRMDIALQLAKAVSFLHKSDLVHRDIKLANVLVSADLSEVKLTDFGLVKGAGFVGHTLVGTPIYLAPELVRGDPCSIAADVFSFGIALWYLAEGSGRRHPDYVEVMPSVGAILLAGALDCRPSRPSGTPESLWKLMEDCWQARPDYRPSIQDVAETLEAIVQELE